MAAALFGIKWRSFTSNVVTECWNTNAKEFNISVRGTSLIRCTKIETEPPRPSVAVTLTVQESVQIACVSGAIRKVVILRLEWTPNVAGHNPIANFSQSDLLEFLQAKVLLS